MSYKVEAISEPIGLGEGPHWDVETQTLFYVDIFKGRIHSYNPTTNKTHAAVIGDGKHTVSLIIPVEDQKGKFLVSLKNDVSTITWDGESSEAGKPEFVAAIEPTSSPNRLNDGKADPKGRLWAGTMGPQSKDKDNIFEPEAGALYTLSGGKTVKKQADKITIGNGLAWSVDNKKMYYIDSMKYRVDSYDYDIENGTISNEKTVFDFKKNNIPGIPDGMTIDAEGKLYVANFGGSQVLRVDPETGEILLKIAIPAPQVTSVAFGGPNFDELYVTTANISNETHKPEEGQTDSAAGRLYKVTNLGVRGLPAKNVVL